MALVMIMKVPTPVIIPRAMPAATSSPIHPVLDYLVDAVDHNRVDAGLLAALAGVPDPRKPRGLRHEITVILALAVCAVLAGARSFTAIGEWAADASDQVLSVLGVEGEVPCESTIRRVLQRVSGDELDTAIGSWAAGRTGPAATSWRLIAVDGKRVRGSGSRAAAPRHLLGAIDHAWAVVLAQHDVEGKTNETTEFAPLLDSVHLAGAVVSADALHAQRGHADYLMLERGAHYPLTVKGNQPALFAQLKALPWKKAPVMHRSDDHAHAPSSWPRCATS
jgi:predicted transposase YbfD/YdcC